MSTEDVTAEIAAMLAEHEYALGMKRGSICTCGHVPTVDPGSLQAQQDYHRHHLADLLAARDRRVRAEAWDEGVEACADGWVSDASNPYRTTRHDCDEAEQFIAQLTESRDRAERRLEAIEEADA